MRKQNGVEFHKTFRIEIMVKGILVESFQATNSKKYGLCVRHTTYTEKGKYITDDCKTVTAKEYNELWDMYFANIVDEYRMIAEIEAKEETKEETKGDSVVEVIEDNDKKTSYKLVFEKYYKIFVWDKVEGRCYHEKYKNGTFAEYHIYNSYPAWSRALNTSINTLKHRRGVN